MLLARGATDGTERTNTKWTEFSYIASIKKHASFIFLANGYTDGAPNKAPEPETYPQTTTDHRIPTLLSAAAAL